MASFEITSPDGRKFQVDAPEGTTADDALAHIQSQYTPQISAGEDILYSGASGLAEGAMKSPLWLGDTANSVVQGITRLGGAAYEKMGGELSPEMAEALTNPKTPFMNSGEILAPAVDFYEPRTTAGQVTNVITNIAGGMGGGKGIQKIIGTKRLPTPTMQKESLLNENPDVKTYGGEQIQKGLTQAEQTAYNAKETAYKTAESVKATVSPDTATSIADSIDASIASLDPEQVTSVSSIRKYTQELRDLSADPNVSGVKYSTIEKLRQRINNIPYKTETSAGKTAAVKAFDDSLDGVLQNGLINGDPQALSLIKEARSKNAYWRQKFTGDKANSVIKDFINKSGGTNEISPESLFDKFSNIGQAGYSNVKALKDVIGSDATPILKHGFYNKLRSQSLMPDGDTIDPQKLSKSIDSFLSNNQSLAKAVFTPEEINALKRTSVTALKYAKTGIAPKGIIQQLSTRLPVFGPLIEQTLTSRNYLKMIKDLVNPTSRPFPIPNIPGAMPGNDNRDYSNANHYN